MNKLKSQEGCKMLSCYDRLVKLRIVNQGTWKIDGKKYTQKSLRGGGIREKMTNSCGRTFRLR